MSLLFSSFCSLGSPSLVFSSVRICSSNNSESENEILFLFVDCWEESQIIPIKQTQTGLGAEVWLSWNWNVTRKMIKRIWQTVPYISTKWTRTRLPYACEANLLVFTSKKWRWREAMINYRHEGENHWWGKCLVSLLTEHKHAVPMHVRPIYSF